MSAVEIGSVYCATFLDEKNHAFCYSLLSHDEGLFAQRKLPSEGKPPRGTASSIDSDVLKVLYHVCPMSGQAQPSSDSGRACL